VPRKEEYWRNRDKILSERKSQYWSDPEKHREHSREYASKHRNENILRVTKWYQDNKERKRNYDNEYRKKNRQKRREVSKKWRDRHPAEKLADTIKRRLYLSHRIPLWADLNAIRDFYKNCPAGYHVDHIIPLHGKKVSGLHVLNNLQYLPATENLQKSNSWGEH